MCFWASKSATPSFMKVNNFISAVLITPYRLHTFYLQLISFNTHYFCDL